MDDYRLITRPGWSNHEFGYKNYAIQSDHGDLYIFPALFISDEKSPRKRFSGYIPMFSKAQVELYAQQLVEFSDGHHERVNSDFNLLVHDLRRLSTAIYHSSEEAVTLLSPLEHLNTSIREARIRIENVIGAQSILKIRTDVLDYSGNPDLLDEEYTVPLYKRCDKVIKSFTAFALKKNIKLHKDGSSFGEAKGPNAFEIIPYVILDNAIKYSPYNNDITIKFHEYPNRLDISFISVGPQIEETEKEEIFQKGFRGKFARKSGLPGSGVGLHLARKIVERFRGSITVTTFGNYFIDQQQMSDISFHVSVPIIPRS